VFTCSVESLELTVGAIHTVVRHRFCTGVVALPAALRAALNAACTFALIKVPSVGSQAGGFQI
jgi:hypothetical protein